MTEKMRFKAVYPIGDTDPNQLPVRDLAEAVSYYQQVLGFQVKSRQDGPHPAATLARDGIEIGLTMNGGDPEQASCYIAVNDINLAFQELQAKELDLSEIRLDEHEGERYRVFFLRAPDGLCYCLGQRA